MLELLAEYAERMMVWLELGLQSAHNETLARINRGHTWNEFLDGYALARRYPLLICPHIIIGLPGETAEHVRHTARELARLKPDGLKIHCLYIHKGTVVEQEYLRGSFSRYRGRNLSRRPAMFWSCFRPDTVIQRLTGDPVQKPACGTRMDPAEAGNPAGNRRGTRAARYAPGAILEGINVTRTTNQPYKSHHKTLKPAI